MDRILKILKKENGPRASSAPALELNTIKFKHVYWYMQLISGERLQDHWSSGFMMVTFLATLNSVYISHLITKGKTLGNDQEKAQPERNSYSENRGGKHLINNQKLILRKHRKPSEKLAATQLSKLT